MKTLTNKKGLALSGSRGFTLIEVVLVLAIGGLIFLLAFIAFQQVSANRRDTQRRADAGRIVAEIQNYKGDKNAIPTTANFPTFITDYMGGTNFKDPTGAAYTVDSTLGATSAIKYTPGGGAPLPAGCSASTTLGSSEFKVEIKLEKGIVCRDSLGNN